MRLGSDYSYDARGRRRWGRRAAGLLIQRDDTGQILLALRSARVLDPGLWGIPGGRVEPGQSDLDAALVETEEELGKFPSLKITGQHEARSGDFTYITFFAVMRGSDAARWIPRLNWENDDWGWFSRLPRRTHPGVYNSVKAWSKDFSDV